MASCDWLTFFLDARIPRTAAVRYAKSFDENRISNDMLLDLNKEYLRDMGIVILGDIIAILKHAKQAQSYPNDKDESTVVVKQPPVGEPQPESRIKQRELPNVEPSPNATGVPSPPGSRVSRRLGPPKPIFFEKEQQPSPEIVTNVFDRLGRATAKPVPGASVRIDRKVSMVKGTLVDGQSEDGRRNVVIADNVDINGAGLQRHPEVQREKPMLYGCDRPETANRTTTRFVMITKKADGSKTRQVLEADDPRIRKLGVTRRVVVGNNSNEEAGVKRFAGTSSRTTEPVKRTRITPPSESHGIAHRHDMREPRDRTLTSRLGRPPFRSEAAKPEVVDRPGHGSQQPVARRKRITFDDPDAQTWQGRGSDEKRILDRLGSKTLRKTN